MNIVVFFNSNLEDHNDFSGKIRFEYKGSFYKGKVKYSMENERKILNHVQEQWIKRSLWVEHKSCEEYFLKGMLSQVHTGP